MQNKHEHITAVGPPDTIGNPLLRGAVDQLIRHKWGESYLPGYKPDYTDYGDRAVNSWWDADGNIQSTIEEVPDDYSLFEAEVAAGAEEAHELIGELTRDVLAPCQEKIGVAIGRSLDEAHVMLTAAAHDALRENPMNPRNDERYQAFQNFQMLVKATAAQLGVVDFQTSVEQYQALPRRAVAEEQLRFHGQRNTYTVDFDGYYGASEMHGSTDESEDAYNDIYDHEYHRVKLMLEAIPTRRFNMSITHEFDSSAEWVEQDVVNKSGKHVETDFSIRFDRDPRSPSGYSLDVGRSANNGSMQRPGDAVGQVLSSMRPEGSHFMAGYEDVTEGEFDEFIANMRTVLQADAEMGRLDTVLENRKQFNHHPRYKR